MQSYSPRRGGHGVRRSIFCRCICRRDRSRSNSKDFAEQLQKLPHLRPRDQKRRKQAEREIVRAVNEQAALKSFRNEGRAFDGELDTDDESFTANLADERKFPGERFQSRAEFGSTHTSIFEKFFV